MTALHRHAVFLLYIVGSLCFLAGSVLSLIRSVRGRLKALGNSVVPQVAEVVGQVVLALEAQRTEAKLAQEVSAPRCVGDGWVAAPPSPAPAPDATRPDDFGDGWYPRIGDAAPSTGDKP